MFADSLPDHDFGVIEDFTVDDLAEESVHAYRNIFNNLRLDHPFCRSNDSKFLQQIGVLRGVSGKNKLELTLGGLLVFGREQSIIKRFPHWNLSYRETPLQLNTEVRWVNRISCDGTWNANLFEFYQKVILKLYEGLKTPFMLNDEMYRVEDTSAHKAVREAFVNTLIHADYEGHSGIRILRNPHGYEFINPGLLLVSKDQVWKGGISTPRNPLVQRLFAFLKLGEREGSGGPAIFNAWSERCWQMPELTQDFENLECHLKLQTIGLLSQESVNILSAELGDAFNTQDELGKIILVAAHTKRTVTREHITDITASHPHQVYLKFDDLVGKGILAPYGSRYPQNFVLSNIPHETVNHERSVYESNGKQSEDLSDEIILFCSNEWRTLHEIANRFKQNPSTLRKKFLYQLLGDGRILCKYPDNPKHPKQAYITMDTYSK
jgi:predicted HTH transcriptional regulator